MFEGTTSFGSTGPLGDDLYFLGGDLLQIPDRFSYALVERWVQSLDYTRILPIIAIVQGRRIVANAVLHFSSNEMMHHRGVFGVWIQDEF